MKQRLQKFLDGLENNKDILNILKHSKNYFSGDFAQKALMFIALPILTRLLSTTEYGIFETFRAYATIFAIVLTLNFHGSIARYYYDEPDDYGKFIANSIIGSFSFLVLAFLIFLLFCPKLSNLLGISETLTLLIFPIITMHIIFGVFNHICIASKASSNYAIVNTIRAYLGLGCGIGLVYFMSGDKFLGLIYGQLIASGLIAVYIIKLLAAQVCWGPTWKHVKYIFNYSVPLIPYTLSNIILAQFDRVIINKTLGASEAGLYSLAYNVGMLTSVSTDIFQRALTPDWFKLMKGREYKRVDLIVGRVFKMTLFIALFIILFSQEILIILADKKFLASTPVIPIVVIGYVFQCMFMIYGRSIGFTKKMIYIAIIGIIASSVNVLLNFIYIPVYGYMAAAYTTVIAFAVMFILSWWVAKYILNQRVTPLLVLWKPASIFSIGVILYYIVLMMNPSFVISIFIKGLILIIFVFFIFKTIRPKNVISLFQNITK